MYRHSGPLCHSARIVIGGVSSKTFIATRTEQILIQSRINNRTLHRALSALNDDLQAVGLSDAFGNAEYRVSVMQTCLYRALLRTLDKYVLPFHLWFSLIGICARSIRGKHIFIH
jgi:CO/xanthine dehydrogenase FAD-binding subunit